MSKLGDIPADTEVDKDLVGLGNVEDTSITLGVASTTTVGIVTVNTQQLIIGGVTYTLLVV